MIPWQKTCFGNQYSCKIGEGSPVECNGVLQGVVSSDGTECGLQIGWGFFDTICFYNNWIQTNTAY